LKTKQKTTTTNNNKNNKESNKQTGTSSIYKRFKHTYTHFNLKKMTDNNNMTDITMGNASILPPPQLSQQGGGAAIAAAGGGDDGYEEIREQVCF
jgi:hypothetical protein